MSCKYKKISVILFALILAFFSVSARKLVVCGPIAEGEYTDRGDIEEVEILPGCGVTEIPDYAFLGCTSLRRVSLPEGVTKIGFQAFSECGELSSINFPRSLEDIGSNSFAYCSRLDGLEFPEGLKHIGHNAFSFCASLGEAILPDSVEEIESYAFSDCVSLRRVRLPGNDRLLGELMMNCCDALTEIEEPSVRVPRFDCDSYIFDPLDTAAYRRCRLVVPAGTEAAYRASASWGLFGRIEGLVVVR